MLHGAGGRYPLQDCGAMTHRRAARGSESTAEFGSPTSREYQLTELKNVATIRSGSQNKTDFNRRLVLAVREHPAFYDAGDEHYGNRHQDASHRAALWQQVASAIGFSGDVHALSQQWKKLKERYTKERRKGLSAGEEPLEESLATEMGWLDEFVLEAMPAASSSGDNHRSGGGQSGVGAAERRQQQQQQLYFMEGEEDLLGEDFVVEDEDHDEFGDRLGPSRGDRGSPARSAHSGTGSDIDVGGVPAMSAPMMLPKEMSPASTSRQNTITSQSNVTSNGPGRLTRVPSASSGTVPSTSTSYRLVTSSLSSQNHPDGITVSGRSTGGMGSIMSHSNKRESSVVSSSGGSTLTMVIDPTTYYQNGTQKMYRLVNVADLEGSQHATLQHLRPASSAAGGGSGGLGGGGLSNTLLAEPERGGIPGMTIGRGTRKRMAPMSPPPSRDSMLTAPSSVDHSSYGKGSGGGVLGDDLILDDGIVGENTIVIDHQRDDDSPLLVDSPGLHHHIMMGSNSRMHRGQHSPTMLGNGSAGVRGTSGAGGVSTAAAGGGDYSPGNGSIRMSTSSNPFSTSQYDADLALQHFISSHLARMNEDDKSLAKMNIQRILLDARFGAGTTLRVCMGEEDADLADQTVSGGLEAGD